MVFMSNDILGQCDFPKGLRVLLLDEDSKFLDELKSKLEKMDYIVSSFCNENEALSAISNRLECFHVAIVEVSNENSHGRFKFLEATKDLPTIMTSNMQCLSTIMKCIALGAVEVLQKPLSEDKLKNLWQHVVHKAFNAGGDVPESLKPIKESIFPVLGSQINDEEKKSSHLVKSKQTNHETSTMSDKCPAPPTPRLKQGLRSMDDDQKNLLTDRENGDQDVESKFVETTSRKLVDEVTSKDFETQSLGENIVKIEDQGLGISIRESSLIPKLNNKIGHERICVPSSRGKKNNRKKMKVDWTTNLHKKFVEAVEQLGVDQAIPSRILELMKVEGLTRHNIASHLQKYRMQHRHILPKDDNRRWPQGSYYPHKHITAYPTHHSTTPQNSQVYHTWSPHGNYPSGSHMWGLTCYPTWQPSENWYWQTYPGMHADIWGRPVMPPRQSAAGYYNPKVLPGSYSVPQDSLHLYPEEKEIDRVLKEVISKPWLPLPIGLNPPSTDSILVELSKVLPNHIINHIHQT